MQSTERNAALQDQTLPGAVAVAGAPALPIGESALVDTGCCTAKPKDITTRRCLDVLGGGLIVLALSVPMLLIALAVKLTSRGPIFYRQRRYGLHGEIFSIWKFRTMHVCESDAEVMQEQPQDPRITPLGKLLRRTSLDELPNFFNVLFGQMSLVGPRPHPLVMDDEFSRTIYGYNLRNQVKPGVTGLAQICGSRGPCETVEHMKNRVALDLYYVRQASLRLDLEIIYRTAMMVLTGRRGYELSDFSCTEVGELRSELIH